MYQLVMSVIHDEPGSFVHDSDSCVSNIADLATGCSAMLRYVTELRKAYGVEFRVGETTDITEVALWAPFDSQHGPASIFVELQRSIPKTDVEDIVNMMRLNARYTTLVHPT